VNLHTCGHVNSGAGVARGGLWRSWRSVGSDRNRRVSLGPVRPSVPTSSPKIVAPERRACELRGMAASESAALADLKAALLKLDATGPEGFEGLLATVLTHLTGQTFRLASSGAQGGEDGSAGPELAFEGKLYKGAVGRNDVLSKVTSLIARAEPPELWILGATVAANTQVLGEVRAATAKNGIATMILDWAKTAPIPPLAVLCALAKDVTAAFLADHVADPALVTKAAAALSALHTSPKLEPAATNLSEDPVRQARALMCLAFGAPSPFAEAQIERFGQMQGFLGGVAETAREAYERNIWSRHWRSVMIAAETPEQYWRASVLLERIVDGRCAYWSDRDATDGSVAAHFDPTLDSAEERRVKGWQEKRKKALFGADLPPEFYVASGLD
jgi:hypothetical protein